MRFRTLTALLAAVSCSAFAAAQTKVAGDPYADDPVGIVADPCPTHPKPTNGYQMYNLHMLTHDHGQLCRYAAQNAALKTPVRVVFMGDSITDNWIGADAALFTNGLVDRGISGQTTPQMLIRFRNDVILLHPKAVHIMAGTNDIAGNTGPMTPAQTHDNLAMMVMIAQKAGIGVLLASVPPADGFPWKPGLPTVAPIRAINAWARDYAAKNRVTFVDYTPALATPAGAMRPGFANDGVHPTPAGYAAMEQALTPILRAKGLPV